jgi:hypothetical protein
MQPVNAHVMEVGRRAALSGLADLPREYPLVPGTKLYRFIDLIRNPNPHHAADGPWWWEFDPFQQIKHFGLRHGYSFEYSARLHGAILYEWSEVNAFVRAEVRQPLEAWKGRGRQVVSTGKDQRDSVRMTPMQSVNEVYQLYIPGIGGPESIFSSAMRVVDWQRM